MKKLLKVIAVLLLILILVYVLGPRPSFLPIDTSPITLEIPLESLDDYIAALEDEVDDIKEDNHARIVWADSSKTKTEYSIVYLHGFSATQAEGDPIHREFATRYGANLYLSRLYEHGRESKEAMKNLQPAEIINSAKEAIAIGKLLGDKIILLSCSTGSTYSIILAPKEPAIVGMIMYSPNIDVYDDASELIIRPWGRQLLTLIKGEYTKQNYPPAPKKYWSESYHTDGLIALKRLLEDEMIQKNFEEINIPTFVGYYYKDDENKDEVVSIPRMLDFYNQITTDPDYKEIVAFSEVGNHILSSDIFSKDLESVRAETYDFAERVLKLVPVEQKFED